MSSQRRLPSKAVGPKSNVTVNKPFVTGTVSSVFAVTDGGTASLGAVKRKSETVGSLDRGAAFGQSALVDEGRAEGCCGESGVEG
jgi:hypothetical protein